MRYATILIDPPWPEYGGGKIRRGANRHYKLMSIVEIEDYLSRMIAEKAAPDCHLYLWVTNNYLPQGIAIIQKLGFQYKTIITWMKDRIGLGQYFRGMTEHCLFATRGRQPYKLVAGKRQQGVTGFSETRREHSCKPEAMYAMAEKVSYPPFLEVFARRRRVGWDAEGDEIGKFQAVRGLWEYGEGDKNDSSKGQSV